MSFFIPFVYRRGIGSNGGGGGNSPTPPSGSLLLDLDPNLGVFSDASKLSSSTDGDLVYTWVDQSPNSYDVKQTDSSERPVYKTDGDNGEPYVWFDDSFNTHMFIPNDSSFDTSSMTIFIVAEITPVSEQDGDNFITNSYDGTTETNGGWRVYVEDWDSPGYSTPTITAQMENSSSDLSITNAEVNQNQVIVHRFEEGVSNKLRVNNLTESNGPITTNINYGTRYDVVLGARRDSSDPSGVALYLPHKLYRCVIYDEYLDDSTVSTFVNNLMNHHNI